VQPDSDGSNLARWLDVARRRGVWIPVCVLLGATAAFAVSKSQATRYTATASLLFKSNHVSQQIAGLPTNVGSQAEQNNSLRLVQFSNVAAATAGASGGRLSVRQVSESVSVEEQGEASFPGESSVITVSATSKSPTLAAEIANAYAKQFASQQRAANHQYFESALGVVEKQLNAVPRRQRFSTAAVALQTRAQSLRLLAELEFDGVEVGRTALVPSAPSSPRTLRNTAVGGALGLLIGLCAVFLLEHLDGRLRDPNELERIYRSPLLGTVRRSASLGSAGRNGNGARSALAPGDASSFGLMLAHLRSFSGGCDLRSVLVGSCAGGEGNTTVAMNLAEAAARSGAHVLLLEVNLRRPAIAGRLGIRDAPGLTAVLSGAMPFEEATQPVELRVTAGARSARGRLDVLVAGALDAGEPGELLGGQGIEVMLVRAKLAYELVVLDAPPMELVADAFPLVRLVDGVVIVGSIGRSRTDSAERLHDVLSAGCIPVLGVIANRVRSRRAPAYSFGGLPTGTTPEGASAVVTATDGVHHAARV